MNDAQLIERARRGDRQAADELVDRYYPSVLRFLDSICESPEDAEELTQESFVKALRDLRKFRGESSLRTWIHSIAYHEFTRRRRRRRPTTRIPDELRAPLFEESSADAMDLERALQDLPPEQRTTFVLCDVQELSMEEVAWVTRSPVGTVKSRLFTARRRLKALLSGEPEVTNHA